jgi:aryl sulfotransferase
MKGNSRKKLVWIASYPKSGNTWVRIFLSNFIRNENSPIDINSISDMQIFSSRRIFDDYSPVFSSDMREKEIDEIRHDVYCKIAEDRKEKKFFKIHDALYKISNDKYMIPIDFTFGAIHIVRHPFDVAVSYAAYSNITIEKSVDLICNPKAVLSANSKKLDLQIRQKLSSWNLHTKSWCENDRFPTIHIRYEDMLKNTIQEYTQIVRFLELENDVTRIEKAVNFSDFKELKKQEEEKGFNERPSRSEKFFRQGIIGDGQQKLTIHQKARIVEVNYEYMKKFGYI